MFSLRTALVMAGLSIAAVPAPGAGAAGPDVDPLAPEVDAYVPDLGVPPAPSRAGQPAFASEARAAAILGGTNALRLVWTDPAEASGRSALAARAEAARLLRQLGLAVSWRRAGAAEPVLDGEVRVILLDRAVVGKARASVLGATPTHVEGPPFVWIHVPGVRQATGVGAGVLEANDGFRLGVALGRVIAHELVHALAPSVPHGEGLMKSRLTRADLTTSAPVTPQLAALVRAALAGVPGPARPDTGLLAAEHARGEQRR